MRDDELRDEINKRLTLNWLIQGASQHVGMTLQYIVRDELDALDPRLGRMYEQLAPAMLLQFWHLDAALLLGWPPRFWRRVGAAGDHLFSSHPLLPRFGGMLAQAARQRAAARSKEKGMTQIPFWFSVRMTYLLMRLWALEAPHRAELVRLARKVASTVWGIDEARFDAAIEEKIELGQRIPSRSFRGAMLRFGTVGYGCVERRGEELVVFARGTNWLLLTKELVKGTAELICLHGLNRLDEAMYRNVMDVTDRIEYEPYMLQSGGELWRRLLAVIPAQRSWAKVLMHLARLPGKALHELMEAVVERPEWAGELVGGLGVREGEDSDEDEDEDEDED